MAETRQERSARYQQLAAEAARRAAATAEDAK